MSAPTTFEMEIALRELLRASQAYGRTVSDREQRLFSTAFAAAQNVLERTKGGRQKVA